MSSSDYKTLPTTFFPQISLNGRWSPSTPLPACGIQSTALIILCVSLIKSSMSLNSSIFTCHFFPHWSDTYSVPLSPHRHSQLLGFALFNYQPCRWSYHVNAFIIKTSRLILESQLLAPIQCPNKRCPQECAWGKAKG